MVHVGGNLRFVAGCSCLKSTMIPSGSCIKRVNSFNEQIIGSQVLARARNSSLTVCQMEVPHKNTHCIWGPKAQQLLL